YGLVPSYCRRWHCPPANRRASASAASGSDQTLIGTHRISQTEGPGHERNQARKSLIHAPPSRDTLEASHPDDLSTHQFRIHGNPLGSAGSMALSADTRDHSVLSEVS